MGLSDRDYAREGEPGLHFRAPQTAVGTLILANVIVYVADMFLQGRLSEALALRADVWRHPWNVWQLVTYGFVHSPHDIWHILGNMIGLWFFGNDIERVYGRKEFFRIYSVALVAGGLVYVLMQNLIRGNPAGYVIGASGAVTCMCVLFALHYPKRMVLFMFFIPMPMWLFGIYFVARDLQGFLSGEPGVAFDVHLTGAALAAAYMYFGWNFGRMLPRTFSLRAPLSVINRPKLKVHQPPAERPNLDSEVDRILEKISSSGSDSLTTEERRTLERASARYQRRRN